MADLVQAQETTPGEDPGERAIEADTAQGTPALDLEAVVVTATANPITRIRSSASGGVVYGEDVVHSAPSNAADIVRNIPAILAQASGGEGNANVSARGLRS